MDSKEMALLCADIMDDKKGYDIIILYVEKLFVLSDYFVICSGNTPRHVQAISEDIVSKLKEKGVSTFHIEGLEEGKWVLVDAKDIIVHVYLGELRSFYELEDLWGDAPKLPRS